MTAQRKTQQWAAAFSPLCGPGSSVVARNNVDLSICKAADGPFSCESSAHFAELPMFDVGIKQAREKGVLGYRARSGDLRISMLMSLQSFALPTELNRDELRNFRTMYICQPRSHTSCKYLAISAAVYLALVNRARLCLRVDHSLCLANCSMQQL